ncbi:MAG: transposase [Candidatus Omnitrophica bacterium]|nr:transposase [Candidatus Omnitrophota bacterium]MCM8801987.1 transposase [Candidatus Omnitrophota bacterium]
MDREQAKSLIIETFENPFNKDNFIKFITNLLKSYNREKALSTRYGIQGITERYLDFIKGWERIGVYENGGKRIDILVVELKKDVSLYRARSTQRNFIAEYLQGKLGTTNEKDAALCAFVSQDSEDWRFSLVKTDYRFGETPSGKPKGIQEFTPAKRWSFLVGKNEKSHTAQSRFLPILENDNLRPTLEDLEEAFNVEVVTKEFFQKYRELFIRTKLELDKVAQTFLSVNQEFIRKNINTVDFAKKLLGQIVFLYFLQKKGWFGVERGNLWGTGPKDFIRRLFKKEFGDYQNFYNDILEPLFYEALRTDRSADDHYYSRFNCKIPFLNGGLFDPINNFDWVNVDILLPNELFSNSNITEEGDIGNGILDVFDRYNFTVNEEEPLEKEVALDPELLGKIYEKLNAIRPDNFDEYVKVLRSGKKGEEVKFNKEYGVYYTPREIVHYMCQESLINYLSSSTDIPVCESSSSTDTPVCESSSSADMPFCESSSSKRIPVCDIEKFVKTADLIKEKEAVALEKEEKIKSGEQKTTKYESKIPESIRQNAKKIDNLLANIKVCDPAVGSGAFPIGMMHEIVKLRQLLSVYCSTDTPVCESGSNTDILVCEEIFKITSRNLPHWQKSDAIYWVTFRLADSLPKEKLNQWKEEYENWLKSNPKPWSKKQYEEYNEKFLKRIENWLDNGYGSCILAKEEILNILKECLFKFDNQRYKIHAAVIMPNHVHLLIEPFPEYTLSDILKGIKGASANAINKKMGTTGKNVWMEESYDHIVRSEKEYYHFLNYIIDNPQKANLSEDKYYLYVSQTPPDVTQTLLSMKNQDVTQTFLSVENEKNTQARMPVLHSSYDLKRHCIEKSLYGVDIDPGAVEICKLRFWLSLIVDEEDFDNIKPLPNLDYKVVCGDSLLGVEKDLFNQQAFVELEKLKHQYFNETNPAKKQQLKDKIDKLIFEITKGHKEFDFEVYFSEVFHQKETNVTQTFLSVENQDVTQTSASVEKNTQARMRVLHQKGGFDIVIANPPYIDSETMVKRGLVKEREYIRNNYKFVRGNWDIYIAFFEKGLNLLSSKGNLIYITPDKWLTKPFGEEFRTQNLSKLASIVKCGREIFETSLVDSVITSFAPEKSNYIKIYEVVNNQIKYKREFDKNLLRPPYNLDIAFSNYLDLLVKIENNSSKLKDLGICENACATSDAYKLKSMILDLPFKEFDEKKYFKVINTGTIGKYISKWGYKEMVFIKDKYLCPVVEKNKFLRSFNEPYIKRTLSKKIIIKGITLLESCIDLKGQIIPGKSTLVFLSENKEDILLSLIFLNSRIAQFYLRERFVSYSYNQGVVFTKDMINNLPIPSLSVNDKEMLINLVSQILSLTQSEDYLSNPQKQAKVKKLETQIDQLVYKLYNLTEEEIRIIEGVRDESP